MSELNKEELRRLAALAGKSGRNSLDEYYRSATPSVTLSLLDENDQLRAEVEALRKDAARWNWYAPKVAARVGEGLKEMNADIDAAMAKEGSANG